MNQLIEIKSNNMTNIANKENYFKKIPASKTVAEFIFTKQTLKMFLQFTFGSYIFHCF